MTDQPKEVWNQYLTDIHQALSDCRDNLSSPEKNKVQARLDMELAQRKTRELLEQIIFWRHALEHE